MERTEFEVPEIGGHQPMVETEFFAFLVKNEHSVFHEALLAMFPEFDKTKHFFNEVQFRRYKYTFQHYWWMHFNDKDRLEEVRKRILSKTP